MPHNAPITPPLFVTCTGADSADAIPAMQAVSTAHNGQIEWGILICPEQSGRPRFPSQGVIDVFCTSGLRLSAHVCGAMAEAIFAGQGVDFDFSGFRRIQVNKFNQHATPAEIENAITFGRKQGIRTILQCGTSFPTDTRADWLVDNSFGQGKSVQSVPPMHTTQALCGISGGLSAHNIQNILAQNAPQTANRPYWIDAESALFANNQFCPNTCANFAQNALY